MINSGDKSKHSYFENGNASIITTFLLIFLDFIQGDKDSMRQSLVFPMLMIGMLLSGTLAHNEDKRKCSNCKNCCNNNCVSGEMLVEELTKGTIRVSQLSNGDIIPGIRGADRIPGWCRVEAVYPRKGDDNFTTYDGFTADHMVIDADIVRPYGNDGKIKKTQLYVLSTECDAAVNAAGQAFTPISTTFCPHELSWSEYLPLIAAIRRVTSRTGYFWYFSDAFYDNETAKVPHWKDMLHDMCTELLQCAREGRCQKFEKMMEEFVHDHLNAKYKVIVDNIFPNIGGDVEKAQVGTVTELVRPQRKSHTMLYLAVGSATAMALIVIAAAVFVYRARAARKIKGTKEADPNDHPQAQVQEVEA